jgi:hypothetical protein
MFTCFHGCGMISVLPIGGFPLFPLIVCLATAPRHQLHEIGDYIASILVIDKQMDVIRSDHIVQHAQTKSLLGLE